MSYVANHHVLMKAPVFISFAFCLFLSIALSPLKASFAENNTQELCSGLGNMAESMMRGRQSGVSLSKVMEMIEEQNFSAGNRRISQRMTADAYSRPRYQTDEFRQRAIEEFKNEYEVNCYREFLDLN